MKKWKKLLGMMLLAVAGTSLLAGSYDLGEWNRRRALAKKLYGRINFVEVWQAPDYRVYVSDVNADLYVYKVSASTPKKELKVGVWSDYPYFDADFRVAIVDDENRFLADLDVCFVSSESSAGLPYVPTRHIRLLLLAGP